MAMTLAPTATTYGAALQLCQKEDLDAFGLSWATDAQANVIENFAFDERSPTSCYVYPPPGSAAYVELVYVADPTDCATAGSAISVPDRYGTALRYFVLALAYERDIEGANPERAEYYRQLALAYLAGMKQNGEATSPNVANQEGKIAQTGKP